MSEYGYGVSETARNLGIDARLLGRCKREFDTQAGAVFAGNGRMALEQVEGHRFRDDNKPLRMERDM